MRNESVRKKKSQRFGVNGSETWSPRRTKSVSLLV